MRRPLLYPHKMDMKVTVPVAQTLGDINRSFTSPPEQRYPDPGQVVGQASMTGILAQDRLGVLPGVDLVVIDRGDVDLGGGDDDAVLLGPGDQLPLNLAKLGNPGQASRETGS